MSDDEYAELQDILVLRPDIGIIIKETGGLRKLRWKRGSKGKRGGLRIIYYCTTRDEQIYLLYVYRKSEQNDLTAGQQRALRQLVERWSDGKKGI
jgi:hypothetical protein